MSQLPLAAHQSSELDNRRRLLARTDLSSAQVNLELVIPRLEELDWSSLFPDAPELRKLWVRLAGMEPTVKISRKTLSELAGEALGAEPELRTRDESGLSPGAPAPPAQVLERRLSRFFEWSESPAFEEMQPVLQFSLTQLRLLELRPFKEHSFPLGFWFGAVAMTRKGYLLPTYSQENLQNFPEALKQGLQFETTPLVGLNLDAMLRSYEAAMDYASSG